MAFWGVEVKPGKPVTHSCEKARGRLRISQATLGISDATKKSLVQCNVGNRSPVLLCALLPNSTESCHLDLEFDEADDVVFSVIGPRSVYLTGYYVHRNQQSNTHSDTESYGVDIENSHTEGSSYDSADDKYDDSFIDDDDELQVSPPSPVSSGRETEEAMLDHDKMNDGKGGQENRKKKYQVIESDSEDDNGYLLSVFKNKTSLKTTMSNGGTRGNKSPGKEKKKRKERSKEEKVGEVEAPKNLMDMGANCSATTPKLGAENLQKSKKRKKGMLERTCYDELLEATGKHQEQENDNDITTNSELLASDHKTNKKIRKKKQKKNEGSGGSDVFMPKMTDNKENTTMKYEHQPAKAPIAERALSNGLIIEEVAHGPPDGKVAALGKKVKIYYTAMLKESGRIFDSNVGKPACKFLLGDKEVIGGWNMGIDGMHVGDKRRLIIPPSMGYGKHGAGENVPPNSWLVYEVQLASVR